MNIKNEICLLFFVCAPVGVATANHLTPSNSVCHIFLCHSNALHGLPYYIHKPPLDPCLLLPAPSLTFSFQNTPHPSSAHVQTITTWISLFKCKSCLYVFDLCLVAGSVPSVKCERTCGWTWQMARSSAGNGSSMEAEGTDMPSNTTKKPTFP